MLFYALAILPLWNKGLIFFFFLLIGTLLQCLHNCGKWAPQHYFSVCLLNYCRTKQAILEMSFKVGQDRTI